ncbi:MAG: hypothetical protein MOB07_25220 [Acidobacteria bacterium]|nr:hypothetical protein [Acidobacteriota bacterium]
MIVLDEQLLGRGLESEIAAWYRGKVCFIHELRPQTVVKDDAIPALLRLQRQPTFVTINDHHFWRKVAASARCCVVCFDFSDAEARLIPPFLKRLLDIQISKRKRKEWGV